VSEWGGAREWDPSRAHTGTIPVWATYKRASCGTHTRTTDGEKKGTRAIPSSHLSTDPPPMSIRSATNVEEDVGLHSARHYADAAKHAYHEGTKHVTRGYTAAKSAAHSVGGHIWRGLQSLGGHAATFAGHVATAHHEVTSAMQRVATHSRLGAAMHARVSEHHLRNHHQICSAVHEHLMHVAKHYGMVHVQQSANHIHNASEMSHQGHPLSTVLTHTVHKHTSHGDDASHDQQAIVSKVHAHVKEGGPSHHSGHRAATVVAQTATSMLATTAAGAAHVEGGG
jgi:hypothetical protein